MSPSSSSSGAVHDAQPSCLPTHVTPAAAAAVAASAFASPIAPVFAGGSRDDDSVLASVCAETPRSHPQPQPHHHHRRRRRSSSAELAAAELDAPAALLILSSSDSGSSGSSSGSGSSSDDDNDSDDDVSDGDDEKTADDEEGDDDERIAHIGEAVAVAAVFSSTVCVAAGVRPHSPSDGTSPAPSSPSPRLPSPSHTPSQSQSQSRSPPSSKTPKRVRWSTITVHEFGVGLGGSAVPSKGGASIGLADTPEFTWVTKVGEMAECSEGVHRFSPAQRKRLLQSAGVEDVMIERYARETSIILGSRRRTILEGLTGGDASSARESKPRKRRADEMSASPAAEGTVTPTASAATSKTGPTTTVRERPCAVYSRRPRMIPINYV